MKQNLKKLISRLLILFLITGCYNTAQLRSTQVSDCDDYINRFDRQKKLSWLGQNSKAIGGSLASLSIASALAIGETAVYVTGGFLAGALVCSPLALLESALDSDGEATSQCFGAVASQAVAAFIAEDQFSLTQDFWQRSSHWRNRNYDYLAVYIYESTECRINQDNDNDLIQARRQLEWLQNKSGLYEHLTPPGRDRLKYLQERLSTKQSP